MQSERWRGEKTIEKINNKEEENENGDAVETSIKMDFLKANPAPIILNASSNWPIQKVGIHHVIQQK